MKIKGLTLEQIREAAQATGDFKIQDVKTRGNFIHFTLRMASPTPSRGDREWARRMTTQGCPSEKITMLESIRTRMRYRKRCAGNLLWGSGPMYGAAVCFHGFREFMRCCFDRNPDAIISTMHARYAGLTSFMEKWPWVAATNVGSSAKPVPFAECCDCTQGHM